MHFQLKHMGSGTNWLVLKHIDTGTKWLAYVVPTIDIHMQMCLLQVQAKRSGRSRAASLSRMAVFYVVGLTLQGCTASAYILFRVVVAQFSTFGVVVMLILVGVVVMLTLVGSVRMLVV